MYAEERRSAIVDEARNEGRVRVVDLAARFEVAPETIRRDLDLLEADGVVKRVHGGAIPVIGFDGRETTLPEREIANAGAKRAMAEAALSYVPHQDGTIILDAGSSTGALAALLVAPGISFNNLTIVTDSVPAAMTLSAVPQHTVHILGGSVRGVTQSTVGATALETLRRLRVDVAFVGTNGISATFGLTTPDAAESAVKRAMIAAARRTVALADRSKFGHDFFISFAALSDIDVLITDGRPPAALASALSAHETEVVIA